MYYLKEDKEVNTNFFFENDFLSCFQSYLSQKASRHYLQAMEDSELLTFSFNDLEKAYDRSHNWERIGRKLAEECYIATAERSESFLFLTGEERYLDLLEKKREIFERIPLYHIASYLGIERESLSRLRKNLIQKTIVT
jgi:CRP-like cAMP-binding protein